MVLIFLTCAVKKMIDKLNIKEQNAEHYVLVI